MPRLSDQMWKAILNDVENTLNMVERVAPDELSTGHVVSYKGGKQTPIALTNYETWRLATLELLLDVWGDMLDEADQDKYQALRQRKDAVLAELAKKSKEILAGK